MLTADELLNLDAHVGQVSSTFRFDVVDGVTGVRLGQITPLRSSTPTLEHDTDSTISRRLTGVTLGVADSADFNPLRYRVEPVMILGDAGRTEYPLGRYMVSDDTAARHSQGTLTPTTFFDEMFIVDQELEQGFNALGQPVDNAIRRLLDGLPIGDVLIEGTASFSTNSWSAGASRGTVLNELATIGGYFKPWFAHDGRLHIRQAFEPGTRLADINLDAPPRVFRESIAESSDLLTAPNRYKVISNNTGGTLGEEGEELPPPVPVVGVYDIPSSAPHSIAQRGFIIPKVMEAQVTSTSAAALYARTWAVQAATYERAELTTPPDPRHDGYNVVRWDERLWLEVAWSMPLVSGGGMRHKLRRAYPLTSEDVTL